MQSVGRQAGAHTPPSAMMPVESATMSITRGLSSPMASMPWLEIVMLNFFLAARALACLARLPRLRPFERRSCDWGESSRGEARPARRWPTQPSADTDGMRAGSGLVAGQRAGQNVPSWDGEWHTRES